MAGKKGMKHYKQDFKNMIISEYQNGMSVKGLSKKYNVSRRSIQRWCGLAKIDETIPKTKGRPKKTQPTDEERIRELERENNLLRSFLVAAGRM